MYKVKYVEAIRIIESIQKLKLMCQERSLWTIDS